MQRILYINGNSEVFGGGEQSLISLIRDIDKNQFRPIAVLPEEGPLVSSLKSMDVKVYVLPLSKCPWASKINCCRFWQGLQEKAFNVVKVIKTEEIDLVHSNSVFVPDGAIAAKIAGVPHVWHMRVMFQPDHPVIKCFDFELGGFARVLDGLSDKVIAKSKAIKASLSPFIPAAKIEVIYDGLQLEKFENTVLANQRSLKSELGVLEGIMLICTIGRIDKEKGFDCYIEAASKVLRKRQDVRFLVVGPEQDKILADALKTQVEDLGLQNFVFFFGPRADIPQIMAQIDIFVCSSLTEGLSLVCLEAMACSKPVIATKCGGPEEIVVNGETGFLVGVNETDELASVMLHLLEDAGLRKNMGLKGRERARQFYGGNYVKKLEALYLQLCSEGKTGGVHIPEISVSVLREIAGLGIEDLKHDWRIKQLESFEAQFKGNFAYKSARYAYRTFKKIF